MIRDTKVLLNRELVSLIGGRGSGKSALLETFAFLNEEHLKVDRNDKKKIVEYYRCNIPKYAETPEFVLKTKLVDKNGKETDFEKKLSDHTNLELPFLYLGQESLSQIATNDSELTKTICDLLGIDINDMGQVELLDKARNILSDIDSIRKQSEDITKKYLPVGYSDVTDFNIWIKGYLGKLVDQQKRLSSKETHSILEDINKKTERRLKLKELEEKMNVLANEIRNNQINIEISKFNNELLKIYPGNSQLPVFDTKGLFEELDKIVSKTISEMDELGKSIQESKQKLMIRGIKEDVNSLLLASENIQRQISSIKKDLDIYDQCTRSLKSLHIDRQDILNEIAGLIEKIKNTITESFACFCSSREDSSSEEKELFKNTIDGISIEGKVEFDFMEFAKHVQENYFDNRTISNGTELRKLIAGENSDGSPKEITFSSLATWIQGDINKQKGFSKNGPIGITQYVFTQWPKFLKVRAIAKLNDKPTEVLSIGQRGTLLLKVYLATSSARQVLIIDQPEDNLDNNFIVQELVPLLRKTKKSRQIIMSTHNANLVVNTDSEQIIVAKIDQNNAYFSGSLENKEIINEVCQILEGGKETFVKRREKYDIRDL